MDESAGGSGSMGRSAATAPSDEDVIRRALLRLIARETLRLHVEHRPIPAASGHELFVRAELDDAAMLQHADAVGVTHRREPMRDQDGGAPARCGEDAIED